ncbi:MAG: hypothetical protein JSV86_18690 [Gemmatimonadota bacterium]|nr:MAG: hypothetical protein JSV86_18690 [Gemmatimonadota bacterium]
MADAQGQEPRYSTGGTCDFSGLPGVVCFGTGRRMPIQRLASYVAPVYWFSPDEPLLEQAEGDSIRIPEALPFETAPDRPVVYYQFDNFLVAEDQRETAYARDVADPGNSMIDLEVTGAFTLHFFAYFSSEVGLGAHQHDLEAAEFKVVVARSSGEWVRENTDAQCGEQTYVVLVTRVSAKAHGIIWFWNVIDTDEETRFPMHILVEEGKHGLATDKNGDGYFTPGYDVSRHINDAWGGRDWRGAVTTIPMCRTSSTSCGHCRRPSWGPTTGASTTSWRRRRFQVGPRSTRASRCRTCSTGWTRARWSSRWRSR